MRWSPSFLYLLALFPLVIGSHAAGVGAFALYELAPNGVQKSDWVGFLLYDAAPGLAGVSCALILAAILPRVSTYVPTVRGFLLRTMPWSLLAAVIGAVVIRERDDGDFWEGGQLITIPLAALLAGLATDALVSWRRSSSAPAA